MLCKDIGCAVTRIKDLIRQTLWASGARGVVVGISGGIDSAVAAAVAVKALGADHVLGVHMPSSSSSPLDHADAEELCGTLGIELLTVPLDGVVAAAFAVPCLTDDPVLRGNYTARLRMATLYNIAAARHYLVCGTSNKTEYMIGYSTKWGDSAADIQPLLHLWKKDVYAVAEELGVPRSIIEKAPSAGFWEGQSDEEELGFSYQELDAALMSLEEHGFVPQNVLEEQVLVLVNKSSHKRISAVSLL
ncbi:NAD+ synthase [Methanocorpusculum sp. MG]|uniref:NH(3)-dependent NAD(+) synthetase n=1 Tax=Methanocorpusculum petauri TaxID=3002863 RepID=A0ABT4IF50_9EURY|nr:NAD+ synthase [Methanocorpusculum petauri]MCZ0860363.1 NAD+ synthase [Methanocorpusculum petauri]MCZ9313086.1 NAD+ synthase [Methanocorpusculum sp.]MDE2442991.1 NAD+ synthase [Methanocorpusculum sp.]